MGTKVYPEWVQKQRKKGTTVKKVGNNYYLYKHSSKRIPGKAYPVPVDTYIGKITPDGVEEGSKKKIDTSKPEIIVKEFGFSEAAKRRCPQQWKDSIGGSWEKLLDYMIFEISPETYLQGSGQKLEKPGDIRSYAAKVQRYSTWLKKLNGVSLDDLKKLRTIYVVTIGKSKMLSRISDEQQDILDKLGLELEVH